VTAREDGFTLVELIVVITIIAILLAIAFGFQLLARERASDATAKSNIRVAVPAIESYQADNGSYAGMTVPILQTSYSPGVEGIEILSADAAGYCVKSTVGGRSWYKHGPSAPITTTSCA
jgi:prepilin-type N-terminal cleavage/methylation domain-containing protein